MSLDESNQDEITCKLEKDPLDIGEEFYLKDDYNAIYIKEELDDEEAFTGENINSFTDEVKFPSLGIQKIVNVEDLIQNNHCTTKNRNSKDSQKVVNVEDLVKNKNCTAKTINYKGKNVGIQIDNLLTNAGKRKIKNNRSTKVTYHNIEDLVKDKKCIAKTINYKGKNVGIQIDDVSTRARDIKKKIVEGRNFLKNLSNGMYNVKKESIVSIYRASQNIPSNSNNTEVHSAADLATLEEIESKCNCMRYAKLYCKDCNKVYSHGSSQCHSCPNLLKLICLQCGKQFSYLNSVSQHILKSSKSLQSSRNSSDFRVGENKFLRFKYVKYNCYTCSQCRKVFSEKKNLDRHLLSHNKSLIKSSSTIVTRSKSKNSDVKNKKNNKT